MDEKKERSKAKQVAEEAMPGWRAVNQLPVDSNVKVEADSVGVDIEALKRKYLPGAPGRYLDKHAGESIAARTSGEHTDFVVMTPKKTTDSFAGNKVAIVKKNKIVGTQG